MGYTCVKYCFVCVPELQLITMVAVLLMFILQRQGLVFDSYLSVI